MPPRRSLTYRYLPAIIHERLHRSPKARLVAVLTAQAPRLLCLLSALACPARVGRIAQCQIDKIRHCGPCSRHILGSHRVVEALMVGQGIA
jgi:hypothetical protein